MNKEIIFNVLNGLGLSKALRSLKKNKLTVLSLHRISPEEDYFWNPIKPASFEKLLRYLQKNYSIVSINDIPEIVKKKNPAKPFVVLSFDDGYYDFYEYALPLLLKYKMPANHNIVNECAENNMVIWTQRLNFIFNFSMQNNIALSFKKEAEQVTLSRFNNNWMAFYLFTYKWMLELPLAARTAILLNHEQALSVPTPVKMMNWQQVAECAANGVEIGSHSFSHDVLSTITDEAILNREIVQSTLDMSQKLNKKINILALPNGRGNEMIMKYLAEAGIDYLLCLEEKLNDLDEFTEKINSVYRINMVEESKPAMILRMEMFHAKMKKYV